MAVGLALTTAVLWGVEVNLTKIAVTGVEPLVANALRMPLGALALNAAALLVYRQPAPGRLGGRNTALATVSGLLALFVGSFLYLSGLQQTGAARGVSIAASSPVFALLIGLVVLREFPGWRSAAGVFLVSGGVALITVT
ncbi:MAG: DMT family transporter [Actinobacteria bacterium]|nr:DMT family transporter [Actinomycetota bacterium]